MLVLKAQAKAIISEAKLAGTNSTLLIFLSDPSPPIACNHHLGVKKEVLKEKERVLSSAGSIVCP
jgi:hypothetical protein